MPVWAELPGKRSAPEGAEASGMGGVDGKIERGRKRERTGGREGGRETGGREGSEREGGRGREREGEGGEGMIQL